jgi:hypothetical protein
MIKGKRRSLVNSLLPFSLIREGDETSLRWPSSVIIAVVDGTSVSSCCELKTHWKLAFSF